MCEICKQSYTNAEAALRCEARPVTQNKNAKIGDQVMITQGDGKGTMATVESVIIFDKDWGHYAWERYWHTVGLTAKLNNGTGSRLLTYTDYEPCSVSCFDRRLDPEL